MRHFVVVLISSVLHKKTSKKTPKYKTCPDFWFQVRELTGSISDVDLSRDSAFTHICSCLQHSEDTVCIQLSFTAFPQSFWVLMRTGRRGNRWPYFTQLIEKGWSCSNTVCSMSPNVLQKIRGTRGCCRCDNSGCSQVDLAAGVPRTRCHLHLPSLTLQS